MDRALTQPNGLLAVGGELSPEWLIAAYSEGIFPWFNEDQDPILWWAPDPRTVLFLNRIHITRSLSKRLRNAGFRLTFDRAFRQVIEGCASSRNTRAGAASGTWINARMIDAYTRLHEQGVAHSVEVWSDAPTVDARLVGGLYGVSLGRIFFGESMFSREPDASKVALCHLTRQLLAWDFEFIDCQMSNPHLLSLGAEEISRSRFMTFIEANRGHATLEGDWVLDPAIGVEWNVRS